MASNSANVGQTSKKNVENFTWTDSEVELLLETVKGYASECQYKGIDWESVKAKYDEITNIFAERYSKVKDDERPNDEYPKSKSLSKFTKERVSAKLKAIRQKYKKAIDSGKRSDGGRLVMTFYDLCHDIWAGSPSTTSIEGGIDTSSQAEHRNAVSEQVLSRGSDDEINALFGIEEENDAEPSISASQGVSNRREKIGEFLKNSKEKK